MTKTKAVIKTKPELIKVPFWGEEQGDKTYLGSERFNSVAGTREVDYYWEPKSQTAQAVIGISSKSPQQFEQKLVKANERNYPDLINQLKNHQKLGPRALLIALQSGQVKLHVPAKYVDEFKKLGIDCQSKDAYSSAQQKTQTPEMIVTHKALRTGLILALNLP